VNGAVLPAPRGRIRVAQVVTRFIAGTGGVALRGAEGLDRTRFEPVILTAPGGPLIERAQAEGIEVLTLRHMRPEIAPHDDVAGIRELRGLFEVGRFDVVHTHSAKAGALGRIAARQAGVPVVVHTFHGFPFHSFQSPLRRSAYIAVERRLGRITDRFVAVSAIVGADAVRLGLAPAERVRVIPVSIADRSVRREPASRQRARQLLGISERTALIGTVGRIDHQKAPFDFLEVLNRLRHSGVHAVWIGDGPMRQQVESRSHRLGLDGHMHFLGERDDVQVLLPALDIFVMTSLYEGLPCAVVEAMQCGLPVVATAVNGVPEVIVTGETGLLAPAGRPAACATAVRYLLEHPAEATHMAENGRRWVAGRFGARDAAIALSGLYEEALGVPHPELQLLPEAS
jgi:glycosyltransferase involved in cell wall biosynthesis